MVIKKVKDILMYMIHKKMHIRKKQLKKCSLNGMELRISCLITENTV